MQNPFLSEIIGEDGSRALDGAIRRFPLLKDVILPRAIISWVSTVGKLGYEGEVPGIENSYLSFKKNEDDTYTGALTIKDELYVFNKEDLLHVSASLGVALDLDVMPIESNLKKHDLTQLGRGIDVLVKTTLIKKSKEYNELLKNNFMAGGTGGPALHNTVEGFMGGLKALPKGSPDRGKFITQHMNHAPFLSALKAHPQGQQVHAMLTQHLNSAANAGFRPGATVATVSHKQPQLNVTKSEANKLCKYCGEAYFKNEVFEGCRCISDLAKSIKTEKREDGFVLKFTKILDEDAITAVILAMKR
jgi:hypothetical protein